MIPLEDNFSDVIGKAQRGLEISDSDLAEKARLDWLKGRLPVPQVLYYSHTVLYEYLFISEVAGVRTTPAAERLRQILRQLLHASEVLAGTRK